METKEVYNLIKEK